MDTENQTKIIQALTNLQASIDALHKQLVKTSPIKPVAANVSASATSTDAKEYPIRYNTTCNVESLQHGDTITAGGMDYTLLQGISKKNNQPYKGLKELATSTMIFDAADIAAILEQWTAQGSAQPGAQPDNVIDVDSLPF